jgi:hypothetical protein
MTTESPAPGPENATLATGLRCINHLGTPATTKCLECGVSLCGACVTLSPVRQGSFCGTCAGKLESSWAVNHLETAPPPPATSSSAHCAFHLERNAAATCDRCGNFLCTGCAIPSPWDEKTFCRDCLARLEAEGGGGQIPWEQKSVFFLTRYWRTVTSVLLAPGQFFRQMPARGYVSAITFQYHTWVYITLFMVLLTWLVLPRQVSYMLGVNKARLIGSMALVLVLASVIAPILHFVSAGWMHLHFYLFGARKGFQATYRLTSYTLSIFFPYMLSVLVGSAARSQVLILLLMIGFVILALAITTIGAAKVHRIDGGMAFLAVLLTGVEGGLVYYFLLLPIVKSPLTMGTNPFL